MLGDRLGALAAFALASPGGLWDLGADHADLAAFIKQRQPARSVTAVDRVPSICARIARRHPSLRVVCDTATAITVPTADREATVVIAGLGGDTVAGWVTDLVARHPHHHLHFVLCPVRQCLELRRQLGQLPLALKAEGLVRERGRCYETVWLRQDPSPSAEQRPWPMGQSRWPRSALRERYLRERVHASRFRPDEAADYRSLLGVESALHANATPGRLH
ncbi:MAG: tRNA (adenine(22)-N(1))-methyltransferase TrmK [Pseudomonadota bacterium]